MVDAFLNAVQHGTRRDGAPLYPAMPYTSYGYLTDDDALAIKDAQSNLLSRTIEKVIVVRRAGIDGCVIAVDTFLGSPEHWSGPAALFSRVNGLPDLYQTFLSNVRKAGLTRYIVPMPQTSSTAALILARLQITASIVHVDAAHEYEDVMRDAAAYWALLRPGGYLIGDDYHETWSGVVRAAGEFSAKVKRPLTVDAPKWILQKAPA